MTTQFQITQILRSISSNSRPDLTDGRLRFLPRKALFDVISADEVLKFLQSRSELPDQRQSDFAELIDRISPADGCRCLGSHCTGGRIIFAALLSLPRPELVGVIFKNPNQAICDASLPQKSWPTDGNNDLLKAFGERLSPEELERFLHFTWQMRSPFMQDFASQDQRVVNRAILEYPENASLPWTTFEEKQRTPSEEETLDTERTTVKKIMIHPAHHEVGTLDGPLALKISDDYQAEEKYILEVDANLRTPQHEHIVALLSAFKHRGKFHLILPWARGGNLADLTQKYHTPWTTAVGNQAAADWCSEEWLLAQCLGLAEGLDAVHQRSESRQIHADIKPENILCFASNDEDGGPFTLKLADFGEAQEVDPNDLTISVKRIPHTKTYRPPEHDTDEALSLNYDVWCLGCVFLEFITWAIVGSAALKKFQQDRLDELDERKVTLAKGGYSADTFFKKVSASLKHKFHPRISIGYAGTTFRKGKLPRSDLRRRHNWWFQFTGSTRVKTLRKEAVKNQITLLQEKCKGSRLHAFLEIIDSSMLVVDPAQRAQSSAVLALLKGLER